MELHRRASFDLAVPPLPYGIPRSLPLSPAWDAPKGDSRTIRLLLIEHDSSYAAHVRSLLEEQENAPLEIQWTEWLDAAIHRIRKGHVDAVLLDISLPDISGIEIFRTIHHAAPDVPLIIMADLDDETVACQLIREGAQDYLPKRALNLQHLTRSVRFAVERNTAKKESDRRRGRFFAGRPGRPSAGAPLSPLQAALGDLNQPVQGLLDPIETMRQSCDWSTTLGDPLESMELTGRRIRDTAQGIRVSSCGEEVPDRPFVSLPPLSRTTRILIVEPSDKDYRKVRDCLKGHKEIRMMRVKTIRSALAVLTRHAFDLICLDYFLPDGTGHDFLTQVNESGQDIPVVIITSHSDPMAAAQIIQAGAYDYLPKQKLSQSPLFRVIVNALEKAQFRKQIKDAQRKIVEMSILDDLTGLCNRRYFVETLEKETGRACRYGSPLVLCMMDVDEFKRVNDTFGHQAGDMVLRELGIMFRGSIRLSDVACRYGGEEFALLLPNTDLREATVMGERLRRMVETHPFEWKGTPFKVTLSFGLARLNHGANPSFTPLVEDADKALYTAKRDGKNRVVAGVEDQPNTLPKKPTPA